METPGITTNDPHLTYAQAAQRLEDIMRDMENGNMDVDQLVNTLKEAQSLIAFCKKRLTDVDAAMKTVIDKQSADNAS